MDIKMWNKIQVTAFKMCSIDISDAIEIYRLASLVSHIRNEEKEYDIALRRVIELIEKATL